MNVMKNDFLLKQKRLRSRNTKNLRKNFLCYRTMQSSYPNPLYNVSLGKGNLPEFSMDSSKFTSSRNYPTAGSSGSRDESILEKLLSTTFETSVSREVVNDNNEKEFDDEETSPFSKTVDDSFSGCELQSLTQSTAFQGHHLNSQNSFIRPTQKIPHQGFNYKEIPAKRFRPSEITFVGEKMDEKSSGSFFKFFESNFGEGIGDFTNRTARTRKQSGETGALRNKTPSCSMSLRTLTKTPNSKSTRTPGSGRAFSDNDTGTYVLSVTEGRGHARGEIGIAALDPRRPHLILCQISDSQRYIHSLTKLNVFNIMEIIMPTTFTGGSSPSKLYVSIREHFPTTSITSVQRRHFNEAAGLELIDKYSSVESGSVMISVRDKFYALSAASALLRYVEYTYNVLFAPRSVRVEYQGTEDTMIIGKMIQDFGRVMSFGLYDKSNMVDEWPDFYTANGLELVVSRIRGESIFNNTLLGVLKHCRTKGGARLLRANILQPPCSKEKIEDRLDCVTELIEKPLVLFAVESAVSSFSNVEDLLTLCMHEPQQDGLRAAEYQLKYVLLLKTTLELLPMLNTSLEDTTSNYFCQVREGLQDMRYKFILDRILETVSENAKTVKGSVSAHLHACFAIKTGINGLLDIAKKTYCEIVQEIWDHVHTLQEKYDLPLRMSFTAHRGFHIKYTQSPGEKNIHPNGLPNEFILVQKAKSTYYFYTSELVALDQRSQQVLNEVKMISNVVLFELLTEIRHHIGCLFNLCECIAELDVITSFAHVGSGQHFVRPFFGDSLNVTESRHPILDVIHDGKVVSNDIFADNGKNLSVITGPNQSGKSIYIGQIALLQIMAQIGSYVPAKTAKFRITDRIFSRLGLDDSVESNASTLIAEMRDIEYLRQNITDRSIVIFDELCKGTSIDEGTCLAFVICEEFLDTNAFIFLTTHYIFLTKLEEMYFNVVNYHFESEVSVTEGNRTTLRFSHKKVPGVTKAEQYGLKIAELTSFPPKILEKAKEIAGELLQQRKALPEVNGLTSRYRISQELKKELVRLGPEPSSMQLELIITRFKTLLKNVNPLDYNSVDPHPEQPIRNLKIWKKREIGKTSRILDASEKIKRKYKIMMNRKFYYEAFKEYFFPCRKNKTNSNEKTGEISSASTEIDEA